MTEHIFCNRSISSKAAEAAALAQAVAASGVKIVVAETTVTQRPARITEVYPHTRLKRKTTIIKPLHSDTYLDRRAASKRNRDVAAQVWA